MTDIPIHEGLVVHPGDTLVIRLDRGVSVHELDQFNAALQEKAREGGYRVVVIAADQLAVARPDKGRIAALEQRIADLEYAAESERELRMGDDL
jgi:hypothetical protein